MADKESDVAPRAAAASAAAAPSQRLKLQTSYGQALILGKGYAAPETLAAFARARELLAAKGEASDPFETYYGQWAAGVMSGGYALTSRTATKRRAI